MEVARDPAAEQVDHLHGVFEPDDVVVGHDQHDRGRDRGQQLGRTSTFLGERYRRIVRRRGKLKALVAVARSILVIIWNLLTDPAARYQDLGSA